MSVHIKRIQFFSPGFEAILKSPGVDSVLQAQARIRKAALEASEGEPYVVERMARATTRTVYNVRPEYEFEKLVRET